MIGEDWNTLLPRLERDLRARATADQSQRDDDAWVVAASLLRTYSHILLRAYSTLAQEGIDDIVQDVLLKLQSLQTLQRLRIAGSPAGYIAVMLRNAATDVVRRRQRGLVLEVPLTEDYPAHEGSDVDLVTPERAARLREALLSLKPEERNLLRMRFWRGFSIGQIAEKSGTTYSASAVRLFRILRKLREKLGPNI
jgi:RNA polymerase sigma-70 factor (ECF subfamily)